jgi:hypothetical protein
VTVISLPVGITLPEIVNDTDPVVVFNSTPVGNTLAIPPTTGVPVAVFNCCPVVVAKVILSITSSP